MLNVCKCARRHTPQPIAFAVNGSRDTNTNAAVICRMYISICLKDRFFFVLSILLLVSFKNLKLRTYFA